MEDKFLNKNNRQKYLILAFFLIILATFFVFRRKTFTFFQAPKIEVFPAFTRQEIKIDFQLFEKEDFKNLQLFEEIELFEGEIGRDNPFLP